MTNTERFFLIFFCAVFLSILTFSMTEYWMPQNIKKTRIDYVENIYISKKPYRVNIPYKKKYKSICNSDIHNREFTLCKDSLYEKEFIGKNISFLEIRKNKSEVEGLILSGEFYDKNSKTRYLVSTNNVEIDSIIGYHKKLNIGIRILMALFFATIVFNLKKLRG